MVEQFIFVVVMLIIMDWVGRHGRPVVRIKIHSLPSHYDYKAYQGKVVDYICMTMAIPPELFEGEKEMKHQVKCNTKECNSLATHGVHWTNGEIKVCPRCADRIVALGNIMGFGVPLSTLRVLSDEERLENKDE